MVFETYLQSDLKQGIKVKQLTGNMFTMDNKGNKIIVEVYDNGEPVTLDQTKAITAYMIRSDNKTVIVGTAGAEEYTAYESASAVSLTLPSNAYGVEGQLSIVIKHGGVTVGACTAYVYRSSTDVWVDPEGEIPSIDELEQMLSEYAATNAAAQKVANMTVTAEAASGDTPDVIKTMVGSGSNEHVNLNFKLVRGETGPQGETGAIPVFSIGTVSDVPYGTGASVTITGTTAAPILNFNLQAGQSGNETIDDTKGIGDTDFVWSADQNDKLYGIQDDRTNDLYGYVNYGYDECDQINATNTYAYSCKRNKTIYTFNGTNGSSYDGRIKINNGMARAVTSSATKALTGGTTLIAGHEYLIRLKRISGSYTYSSAIVPTVSAYRQGESSSVGVYYISNAIGESIRTFVAEENIEYMFCIYIPSGGTATNFVCSITIEDLSVETADKTPVTKAPVIDEVIDTSSDVQTFADGADNMPMNLEVGLSHLQDLHGYAYPWVGKMGKNLFSGFKSKSNAVVISNNIPVDFSTNTYYIFSGLTNEINCYAHAFEADDTFVGRNTGAARSTMTLQKTSFSSGGGSQNYDSIAYIQLRYYSVPSGWGVDDADELPTQLEVGDTATAYEPYENICPITGHTGAIIKHGGNLFDKDNADWVNGYTINDSGEIIENNSYRYSNTFFPINGNANVITQCSVTVVVATWSIIVQYASDKTFINRTVFAPVNTSVGFKYVTFKTDPSCAYFRIITPKSGNSTEIMVFYGTKPKEYQPYIKNIYNITFPTSVGTVYDGTLSVDKDGTGTLVSDWYYYSFDGTEDISASSSGANRFMRYNVKDVFPNPRTTNHNDRNSETKSSHFSVSTINSSTAGWGIGVYYSSTLLYIGTRTPDIIAGQTAEEYCAFLAEQYANGTPVSIIYKVAEPVVYYLSAPQVRTLLGFNNIWCNDAGQVINSITYPSDTKTYIDNQNENADGMIAQTEASMTATEAHPVGDVFICNNKLYMAITAIAIGDTIAEGTNVSSTIMLGSTEVPLNLANYIKSVLLDVSSIGSDVNYLKAKVTDPDEALSKTLYIQNGSLTYSNRTVKLKDGVINFTVPNSSGANYRSIWITGTELAGSSDNMANSKPPVDNAVPISKLASANTVRLHYDNISGTGIVYIAIAYCTVDGETVTLVGDKQNFSGNTAKDYVANLVIPETATHYAIQVYQTTAAACEWNAYLQFKKVVEEESATGVSF